MLKQPFNFRSGIVDTSTVKIAVYSLSAAPVRIDVNGASYTPALVGVGTDGAGGAVDSGGGGKAAMYVAVQVVSNLRGWVPYTVTQNGTTLNGRTTPDQGNVAQQLFCMTCDNKKSLSSGVGAWAAMAAYAKKSTSNVTTMIHTDDHGYVDSMVVNDTSLSGLFITTVPEGAGNQYAFVLAYAAYLGLIEGDESDSGYSPDFQDTNRLYCWHNIPMWTQVGDHELGNNPEEDGDRSAAEIANSSAAFSATLGATNSYINVANSLGWVMRVGPVEVVSYDRLTALPGNTSIYNDALQENNIANSTWLGAQQITDIKNALGGDAPFILVAASVGFSHMSGPNWRFTESLKGWTGRWLGAQEPLHDYTSNVNKNSVGGDAAIATTSEMLTLFTEKGAPMSIMQKAASYNATVFMHHGDTHVPRDNHFFSPETSTHAELDVREIGSGGVNLRSAHRLHPIFNPGYSYRGANIIWNADWTIRDTVTDSTVQAASSYLRIEIEPEQDIVAKVIRAEGTVEDDVVHTTVIKRNSVTSGPVYLRKGSI